jgi:MerR family transcriptional regulator, heat shock protein HspR
MEQRDGQHDERAVYVISVAAELAGVHPQTLRIYERKGLLQPKRTQGNTRRYSQRDIEHLRRIQALTQAGGVNLAGVKIILEMQTELDDLRLRLEELEREVRRHRRVARERIARSEPGASILPLHSVLVLPWEGGT